MISYIQHTIRSVLEKSKPIMEAIKGKIGFVTNLMATMADATVLIESYMTIIATFDKTNLPPFYRKLTN